MTTQTSDQIHPHPLADPTATANVDRHIPAGSEIRGFALYVGLAEANLDTNDPQLSAIVEQVKQLIAQLAPSAETYAAVALAPAGVVGGRDLDVVRLALGERAARSRAQTGSTDQDRAHSGIVIDLSRKRVLLDNIPAPLSYREFELLQMLVLREGRTVSREELIDAQWSETRREDAPSQRTIDVHVRRLRVKLAQYKDVIRTVRGNGYRFDRHADVVLLHGATRSPDLV